MNFEKQNDRQGNINDKDSMKKLVGKLLIGVIC